MNIEFLVIGQGICGTWLSWFLSKENRAFVVVDRNERVTPSKVAAGIINPVTGRRMVKAWMAEEVMAFAHELYLEIGKFLDIKTISQKNTIDFFPNAHQRQVFMERVEEGSDYLHAFPEQNQFKSFFNYEIGCGEIRHSYIVHLQMLLATWRQHLIINQQLIEEDFEHEKLVMSDKGVQYNTITADKIIFCDGSGGFENPFFKQLPFAPNKGEALIVEIPGLPDGHIYKKGFLLCPLPEQNLFWLGSSYQWSFENAEPTDEFYQRATRHLKAWLKIPFKVSGHLASVRPATLERRPFVGIHPNYKNVAILNGMGTKGCSLAPFFADQLVQNLVYQRKIDPLADILRFQKILSR